MTVQNNKDSFRDAIATADKTGRRKWIYPRKTSGAFHRARIAVAILLLIFLFVAPFLKINGHPMFLFNILERQFILFGIVFWPQDFLIFAVAFIALLLFIILFTSLYGRLWCGWACPQTIFMEMVFRKIEYVIEGDAAEQKRLDNSPWNSNKLIKKLIKHLIFYSLSFLIANTFLAYIIGVEKLFDIIKAPVSEHLEGFISIQIFTVLFYSVFAFFREQACVIVCPYGKYQSVMVDEKSIAVSYDFIRGEPRRKLSPEDKLKMKSNQIISGSSDCIDCFQCVRVCPTGIDIRDGIQLECINCTACMDACDRIMETIHKPKGLIRYASNEMIKNQSPFTWNIRNLSYSFILVCILSVLAWMLSNQTHSNIQVLRQPGTLFQVLDSIHLSNMFYIKIANKTFQNLSFTLFSKDSAVEIRWIDPLKDVQAQSAEEFKFFVVQSKYTGLKTLNLYYENQYIENEEIEINFITQE